MTLLSLFARVLAVSALLAVVSADCDVTINRISGCPGGSDGWAGTLGCQAGMTITMAGQNFVQMRSPLKVELVYNLWCTDVTVVSDGVITAVLPSLSAFQQQSGMTQFVQIHGNNTCSSATFPGVTYATNSSSSSSTGGSSSSPSSTGSAPPPSSGVVPVVYNAWGCNSTNSPNNTNSPTNCDGSTGNAIITISGANFTNDNNNFKAQVSCVSSSNVYTLKVLSFTPTLVTCYTPTIQQVDANALCGVGVINADGTPSTSSAALMFVTWSTSFDDAARLLGMSLMTAIIIFTVVGVVILVATILCTLACCCGVSLACLNCCTPRSRSNVVVLSPAASGYSSMA